MALIFGRLRLGKTKMNPRRFLELGDINQCKQKPELLVSSHRLNGIKFNRGKQIYPRLLKFLMSIGC